MLYIRSPELIHLITGSLCSLTTFTHFPHPTPRATTNLLSVSMSSHIGELNPHGTPYESTNK